MSTSETTPPASAPAPAPVPERVQPKQIGRLGIGVNVLVQFVVVLAIILMVNGLSFRHFRRWDYSRNQKFALSSQTKNLLNNLDAPVQAIVFFPRAQIVLADVVGLLKEYEYASHQKVVMEVVDPYHNFARAKELSENYKFGAQDDILILDYKGKSKFLNARDMVEMNQADPMNPDSMPTVRFFKGEELITSALLEITQDKQTKLYVLGGHGEPTMDGGTLTGLKFYLDRQNLKTQPLNLNNVDTVPADASGLLVFGSKSDFSDREIKLLDEYWGEKKGRLFVLLDPAAKTPNLNAWLANQGVSPQNDRVIKTAKVLVQGENGAPEFKNGIVTAPVATLKPSGDISKDTDGIDIQFIGGTESLLLDRSKPVTDKIKLIPLAEAGDDYWGSVTFNPGDNKFVFFDPSKDHKGPLTVGAAVEKGALGDTRVKVETARMIVIGNSGFLTDPGLKQSPVGGDFALNAINWLVNREAVAGIAPKSKQAVQLNLSSAQMNQITWLTIVIIPCFAAILGIGVWWQRRA